MEGREESQELEASQGRVLHRSWKLGIGQACPPLPAHTQSQGFCQMRSWTPFAFPSPLRRYLVTFGSTNFPEPCPALTCLGKYRAGYCCPSTEGRASLSAGTGLVPPTVSLKAHGLCTLLLSAVNSWTCCLLAQLVRPQPMSPCLISARAQAHFWMGAFSLKGKEQDPPNPHDCRGKMILGAKPTLN